MDDPRIRGEAKPAAFRDLERYCATQPEDNAARRRLLQILISLGGPDQLPGSSLSLPHGAEPLRVAVLTPYFREPLAVLERCHRSVGRQTVHCEHILVADGHPRVELDSWPIRHLRLASPTNNFGDTPRRIAGEAAIESGFDAVVYLDADNWLRPHHVESLMACHLTQGAALCHSARTLHQADGTLMPLIQRGDNVVHVDTSCLFVASSAFDLLSLWGAWPRELSCIDDRMFWHAAMARGYSDSFTGAFTTCYTASHRGFFRALGEMPPADARPDLDLSRLISWHAALPATERDSLDQRWGFSVSSLIRKFSPQ